MRNKGLIIVPWRVVDFGVNHLDNLVIVSNFLMCYVWWNASSEEESSSFFFSESLSLHITHEEISETVKFSPITYLPNSTFTTFFKCFILLVWMNECVWSTHFLALLKPEKFRPERGVEPWPLRCRCSDLPVELSGQLGAGRYVEIDHDNTRICIANAEWSEWMWSSHFLVWC